MKAHARRLLGLLLALAASSLTGCVSAFPDGVEYLTQRVVPADTVDLTVPLNQARSLHDHPVVVYQLEQRLVVLVRETRNTPNVLNLPPTSFRSVELHSGRASIGAYTVEDLDRSIIDITVADGMRIIGSAQFRGVLVDPAPDTILTAGVVTQLELTSMALGEIREILIYQPRAPAVSPSRVLYVLDRASDSPETLMSIVDDLIASGRIPATVVVALPMSAMRSQEMHRGLDTDLYERHQRFFFDELMPAIRARFPGLDNPEGVAIIGSSASAAWVLSQASTRIEARHWAAFSLPTSSTIPRIYDSRTSIVMGAGTLDSAYFSNSLEACIEINASGGSCDFLLVRSGHSHGAWDELIRRMLLDWSGSRRTRGEVNQ